MQKPRSQSDLLRCVHTCALYIQLFLRFYFLLHILFELPMESLQIKGFTLFLAFHPTRASTIRICVSHSLGLRVESVHHKEN